jgi:hypothetical protein
MARAYSSLRLNSGIGYEGFVGKRIEIFKSQIAESKYLDTSLYSAVIYQVQSRTENDLVPMIAGRKICGIKSLRLLAKRTGRKVRPSSLQLPDQP